MNVLNDVEIKTKRVNCREGGKKRMPSWRTCVRECSATVCGKSEPRKIELSGLSRPQVSASRNTTGRHKVDRYPRAMRMRMRSLTCSQMFKQKLSHNVQPVWRVTVWFIGALDLTMICYRNYLSRINRKQVYVHTSITIPLYSILSKLAIAGIK